MEDAIPFVENAHLTLSSWALDEEDFDVERFEEMNTEAENLQSRRDAMQSPIREAGDPNLEDCTIMMSRREGEEEWRVEGEDLVRILNDTGELAWVIDDIVVVTEDILAEDGQHEELVDDAQFMTIIEDVIEDAPQAVEFARSAVFNQ